MNEDKIIVRGSEEIPHSHSESLQVLERIVNLIPNKLEVNWLNEYLMLLLYMRYICNLKLPLVFLL